MKEKLPIRTAAFDLEKNKYVSPPEAVENGVIAGVGHNIDISIKDTNPKDAVGIKKVPFSTIPAPVMAELGVAMLEGARKYGRHNYRISGVRGSVYYDAAFRHLTSWFEGEDLDPDSGLSHITKAIATLVVLRDSMIQGNMVDDRPPVSPAGWQSRVQKHVDDVFARIPEAKPAFTNKDKAHE